MCETERYSRQGRGWDDLLRSPYLEAQGVVLVGVRLVVEGHTPTCYVEQVSSFEMDVE